jgi:hypothetical protein
MSDERTLPDGVELDVIVYATSEATNATLVLALRGFTQIPDFPALVVKARTKGLLDASDWRPMTREEITAFKANEDADA